MNYRTKIVFLLIVAFLLSCAESHQEKAVAIPVKVDSVINTKDSTRVNRFKPKSTYDSSEYLGADANIGSCGIALLNSYEYIMNGRGEGMGVYIFFINEFDKNDKECWWEMYEYLANYDLNKDNKYTCVEVYVLDLNKDIAAKYYSLTSVTLESDDFLMKRTILFKKFCEGEDEVLEVDPFHLNIYQDPIPPGWTAGDE